MCYLTSRKLHYKQFHPLVGKVKLKFSFSKLFLVQFCHIVLILCSAPLDLPTPSLSNIEDMSLTLRWDEKPPELSGNPQRQITEYAVTVAPQDGGPSQTVYVPAEEGAEYTITGLMPGTMYSVDVGVVVDTDGQGELTYDIDVPPLNVNTSKAVNHFYEYT